MSEAANFHGSLEDSVNNALGGIETALLDDIIKDFLIEQDTHYEVVEKHLFPDAVDLAKRLHEAGKRQILVTNRSHEGRLRASPRSIVANSGLHEYIDLVVCGDDSEHRKPKPEVLHHLNAALDFEDTMVIGDQFVDAEFAHNLGARAVLVARNDHHIAHYDKLQDDWHDRITVVRSLSDATVA